MVRNLKDAFYNAQFRVGQGIYTRAVSQGDNSLTESNFTGNDTFNTLIEDDTGALPEFVDSQISMSDAASNGVAMDKISASQTAMDAVAASQTAMDAVASSQTARDVIGFSGLAYDTIANSNMAIGKYAIGYTTESPADYADMDAVASSQTAMDAVASSQTAMDAVYRSGVATDTVWSSDLASETIWKVAGSPSPPHSYDSDFSSSLIAGYNGGQALSIEGVEPQNSGERYWQPTIDLTNVSQLVIATEKNTTAGGSQLHMVIVVGGSEVFNSDVDASDFGWTDRTFDVSGQSGETTIKMGWNFTGSGYSGTFTANFDNIRVNE